MNIVVTGATGFVGRALITRLAQNHNIWAVARRARDWPPNIASIIWDMRQPLEPAHFPAQLDAIIHLAQSRRYRDFPEGTDDLVRINVTAPIELLNWAVRSGIQ